ncbi:hypothetical protein KFE25_011041 [Diacronema lutheri]|uniref:N-acetyltransferase domain-containing protein n=1 Tax=Diacronema lutheri TaxID=2081491 RepID=A0A8J5XFN4_DIALT|nr:hypothetical protein KFE25_011041 [Diacronema lutheri]
MVSRGPRRAAGLLSLLLGAAAVRPLHRAPPRGAARGTPRLCAPSRATIRELVLADVDAAVELDADAHPATLWTREQYAAEIECANSCALGVVSPAGALLGMLFMSTVLDEAMLTNLAVARSVRRRGLASQLLDAALADAREAGVRLFVLEVRQANQAARRLYLSRGFVQAGVRRGYYQRPPDDAAVLLLRCADEEEAGALTDGRAHGHAKGGGPATVRPGAELPSAALRRGVEVELRELWPQEGPR